MKEVTRILHYSRTDPEEKRKIEVEQEAWRTVNAMFEEKEKKYQKTIAEKDKLVAELMKKLEDNK